MNEVEELLQRYQKALDENSKSQEIERRADAREFSELLALLLNFAEQGEPRCQYEVAIIYWAGLCYESEEAQTEHYPQCIEEATKWWVRAASQGHWWAFDNLLVCGVGPEADRVRKLAQQFEEQRPELVGQAEGMPVYGFDFMKALCEFVYGRVMPQL